MNNELRFGYDGMDIVLDMYDFQHIIECGLIRDVDFFKELAIEMDRVRKILDENPKNLN